MGRRSCTRPWAVLGCFYQPTSSPTSRRSNFHPPPPATRQRDQTRSLSSREATALPLHSMRRPAAAARTSLLASKKRVLTQMKKNTRNKKYSCRRLRSSHYQRPCGRCSFKRVANQESTLAATEKCAWKDAICPVCMECPHDAVLLLCSSHGNGCRPYICATNFHHSNCLDQLIESRRSPASCEDPGLIEFTCPLCRGEVKGYTLVEPAREQLNQNRRSCMQDGCSYIGTYRELRKHVRKKHPFAEHRTVDPVHSFRWRQLLFRSALQDMICATSSSTLQRLLCAMLQFEELMSSVWREDDDRHGAAMDLAGP